MIFGRKPRTDLGDTLPKALDAWSKLGHEGARQRLFPDVLGLVRGHDDLRTVAQVAIPLLAVGWESGRGDHLADFLVTLQSEGLLEEAMASCEEHWSTRNLIRIARYIAGKLHDETPPATEEALITTLELCCLQDDPQAIYWLMGSRSKRVRAIAVPFVVSDKELEEEAWLHWDRDVRATLASLDGVAEGTLRRLARDRDDSVAEAAINNLVSRGLPDVDDFDESVDDESVGYFISLSGDPDTLLRAAASSRNEATLMQILTSADDLADDGVYSHPFQHKIRAAVSGNPNASANVLARVMREVWGWEKSVVRIVMDNPNVTSDVLLLIAQSRRTAVPNARDIVRHPKVTPEIISAILQSTNSLELKDTLDLILTTDVLTDDHIGQVAELVNYQFGVGEDRLPMTTALTTSLSQLLMHPKGETGADRLAEVVLHISPKRKHRQLTTLAKLRLSGAVA